jgi:hypothetical protein
MGGGAYRVKVEKPEGKRPSERIRLNLENVIKLNFKEIEPRAWICVYCFKTGTNVGIL